MIEKVPSSWYDSIWMGQLWVNGIYDSKEGNVFPTSVGRMREKEREIKCLFVLLRCCIFPHVFDR